MNVKNSLKDKSKYLIWGCSHSNFMKKSLVDEFLFISGWRISNNSRSSFFSGISENHILNFTLNAGSKFNVLDPLTYYKFNEFIKNENYFRLKSLYYSVGPRIRVASGLYPPPVEVLSALNNDILKCIKLFDDFPNLETVFFGIHPHSGFDLVLYFYSRFIGLDCIITREHTYVDSAEYFVNGFDLLPEKVWTGKRLSSSDKNAVDLSTNEMINSILREHENSDHSRFFDMYSRKIFDFVFIKTYLKEKLKDLLLFTVYNTFSKKMILFLIFVCKKYKINLPSITNIHFAESQNKNLINFLKKASENRIHRNYFISTFPLTSFLVNALKIVNNQEFKNNYSYKKINFKNLSKKRYVLFLFHHQPESTTNIESISYEDQLLFIAQLRSVIPTNVILLVKDVMASANRFSYEKRSINLNNVSENGEIVVLPPKLNTRFWIKHAECVSTINGTLGYEATYFKKPIIYGGCPIWKDIKNSIHIVDLISGIQYQSFLEDVKKVLKTIEIKDCFSESKEFLWRGKFNLPTNKTPKELSLLLGKIFKTYHVEYKK